MMGSQSTQWHGFFDVAKVCRTELMRKLMVSC
jgi:hypothetical protein